MVQIQVIFHGRMFVVLVTIMHLSIIHLQRVLIYEMESCTLPQRVRRGCSSWILMQEHTHGNRPGKVCCSLRAYAFYFFIDDNNTHPCFPSTLGAFSGQPDQIQRILANDSDNDMLYFCEEAASDNGIHARDVNGDFYRIIDGGDLSSETTGLAFSPDNKHMYVSYQSDGYIFDITREDGYPFGAHRLDIKYHAV